MIRSCAMSQDAVEIETGKNPTAAVIWMHGLGADGHDFEPIVPELVRDRAVSEGIPSGNDRALRFVFPHAPVRPVTLNGGYPMRAWYDIVSIDRRAPQDEVGIRGSYATVEKLIRRENERGIATDRIVLAGFSQGGAMALYAGTRYPEKLAGMLALSCYMLLEAKFNAERTAVNHSTSIFLAHGTQDPVVSPMLGEGTRLLLEKEGYSVEWHTYPMPHSVCPQEVLDIAAWLRRVL
jgi:phospholipase/carboxylesterase